MIVPIGERILIRPKAPEEKSKTGIILKSTANDKQDTGEVIAVGDGAEVQRFKIGDKLIFQKYGPARIIDENKDELVIAHLDEIYAIEKE